MAGIVPEIKGWGRLFWSGFLTGSMALAFQFRDLTYLYLGI